MRFFVKTGRTEKKKENIPRSVLENYHELKRRREELQELRRQRQGHREEVFRGSVRGYLRGTVIRYIRATIRRYLRAQVRINLRGSVRE